MRAKAGLASAAWCLTAVGASGGVVGAETGDLTQLLGTWRGSSTCVNRQVAPACQDEAVVYEVRRSEKAETAVLQADKVVNGQRVSMGDLEFVYAQKEGCWRSELRTVRVHAVWCLKVSDGTMSGTLRDLEADAEIRKVQAKRE